MKTKTPVIKHRNGRRFLLSASILIGLVIACCQVAPKAQAVVPAPDGFYPGGNTAEGQNALFSLTTGTFNTAVGLLSLGSNMDASFNTGVGVGTLLANTTGNNTATAQERF